MAKNFTPAQSSEQEPDGQDNRCFCDLAPKPVEAKGVARSESSTQDKVKFIVPVSNCASDKARAR
jgi:hypothetical protein